MIEWLKDQNSWVLGFVQNKSIINSIVPKSNMSFIRVKKIAGKEYAYLVENKWYKRGFKSKGKGSRQRVSKYLGRVYFLNKEHDIDFLTFKNINNLEEYLKNNDKSRIFQDLVEWELHRHNIDRQEFSVDFKNKKVMKGKRHISLQMNEGFLSSFTLQRLFTLTSQDSYYLAKCILESGIQIPQEVFVGVFGK